MPDEYLKPELLVVGAGASIQEYQQNGSGKPPGFPSVANFCGKLFQESHVLQFATAKYLNSLAVPFDDYILKEYGRKKPGSKKLKGGWRENSPLKVFKNKEAEDPETFNIEKLTEYIWQTTSKDDQQFWNSFIEWGIYQSLSIIQISNFLGEGTNYKQLRSGQLASSFLAPRDRILNLNYDTCFDIGLKQAVGAISYAPMELPDTVIVHKPHGSLNLYINAERGVFSFCEPDQIPGTLTYPDPEGGSWHPNMGIVPPRLSKSYSEHPIATAILSSLKGFSPKRLTFWGVGLTESDYDLSAIYRECVSSCEIVDFINPDAQACDRARSILDRDIRHHETLDDWYSSRMA
ncbi:MAG: hypothetical protein ABL869_08580 [Candidatus Nitrotoga sp.]